MILIIILLLITIFCAWYVVRLIDTLRNKLAPDIGTPMSVLPAIYKSLKLKQDSVMFELGCGDGRVLQYCALAQPKARYVGVENGVLQYIKARYNCRNLANVKILFGDFRKINIAAASHVYLYLLPQALKLITPKLPKGSTVVTCQYKLGSKSAIKSVKLLPTHKLASRLWVYRM